MRKLTVFFTLFTFSLFSQDGLVDEIKASYKNADYDKIIEDHGGKVNLYPAKAIYFVGMSYYMKSNDAKCIELMDLSIKKNSKDPDPYYIKAMSFNYMSKFEKAIPIFENAIAIDSTNGNYFSGLGDAYYNLEKKEEALQAYIRSTKVNQPIERPFKMIPQIYLELGKTKEAILAYYQAKTQIPKDKKSYQNVLYNVGLNEYLHGDLSKSAIAYNELIEVNPADYQVYSKLMQVLYKQKEYEKAKPYREKLYEAQKEGKLEGSLNEKFCFDQFEHNGTNVMVFEKYYENPTELYYKHIFYVLNSEGKIAYTVQTENSPVALELGSPKYAIGKSWDNSHSTYGFIEENFNYDDLKASVIKIIDNSVNPAASSTVSPSKSTKKTKRKKNKK